MPDRPTFDGRATPRAQGVPSGPGRDWQVRRRSRALATDNNAPWLAQTRAEWTDPHARHLRAYTGAFRIPPQARPMLRALLLDRAAHPDPPPALIVGADGTALRARRIAHRVRAGADLAGMRHPGAARAHVKRYTPETFATSFTGAVSIHSVAWRDTTPSMITRRTSYLPRHH